MDKDGGCGGGAGRGLTVGARLHLEMRAGGGQPEQARLRAVERTAPAPVHRACPAAEAYHGAPAVPVRTLARAAVPGPRPVALAPR